MKASEKAEIAKSIASKLSHELGFVMRGTLLERAMAKELLIATPNIGFCSFHITGKKQCTIYEIGIDPDFQGQGHGKALLTQLKMICYKRSARTIFAKCPEGLPSNQFYEHMGFKLSHVERKQPPRRNLNCWEYKL
jgi:N-acetylglutamate synthase-like GNAT family acetyltransferase